MPVDVQAVVVEAVGRLRVNHSLLCLTVHVLLAEQPHPGLLILCPIGLDSVLTSSEDLSLYFLG